MTTPSSNFPNAANIVGTMQAHGISHLLTHNTADFAHFAQWITVVPLGTSLRPTP